MKTCPQCGHRLLSQASARCNWCGSIINDAVYQSKAAAEREAFFVHQAQHDTQSLLNTSVINIGPPGFVGDVLGTPPRALPYNEPSVVNTAQEGTRTDMDESHDPQICQDEPARPPLRTPEGRFLHLEW